MNIIADKHSFDDNDDIYERSADACIYCGHVRLGKQNCYDFSDVLMDEYEIFPIHISNETFMPYQYTTDENNKYEIIDSTGLIHKFDFYQLDYLMSKVPHIQYKFKIPISRIGPFEYDRYYFIDNNNICDLNNKIICNIFGPLTKSKCRQHCVLIDVRGNKHEYEFMHLIEYLQKQYEPLIGELIESGEARVNICFEIYDTPEEHAESPLTCYSYPELKAKLHLSSFAEFLEKVCSGTINSNDVRK